LGGTIAARLGQRDWLFDFTFGAAGWCRWAWAAECFNVPRPARYMAASRLLLPMQAAMKLPCRSQGWQHATRVAPSLIAGAGNGRFAGEDIVAGSVVSIKPIQAMATLDSLHSVAADMTLSFSSAGGYGHARCCHARALLDF
jgi:hypothetical protein